jgi:hypothetical protein
LWGTGNREQGAGNKKQGAGNKKQGAGNKKQGAGNHLYHPLFTARVPLVGEGELKGVKEPECGNIA